MGSVKIVVFGIFGVIFILFSAACSRPPVNSPTKQAPATSMSLSQVEPSSTPSRASEEKPSPTLQASPTVRILSGQLNSPTPTQRPTEVTTAAASTPSAPPCLDEAVFVGDVTIPDGTLLRPGQAFTKTWRVKNTGTCTWGVGYSLVYVSGDIMSGRFENPISPVSPGELADISINLVAPARGGEQVGHWQFRNAAGQPFGVGYNGGYPIWVNINVTFLNPNPQPTALVIAITPSFNFEPTPNFLTSPTAIPGTSFQPVPTRISPSQSPPTAPAGVAVPTEAPASTGCAPQQNSVYVDQMLSLINQARAENGLEIVFLQSQLSAAALKHSIDMACNQFVDHHGSDGLTWYDRVGREGYANPRSARENIYVGADAQGTFNWWMNSQVHRNNILFPGVTEIGIGYVFVPGSPYGDYFTLVLAKR